MTLFMSNKVVFKTKSITSNKEGHFMMIKANSSKRQNLENVFMLYNGASIYITQELIKLKEEIKVNIVVFPANN